MGNGGGRGGGDRRKDRLEYIFIRLTQSVRSGRSTMKASLGALRNSRSRTRLKGAKETVCVRCVLRTCV